MLETFQSSPALAYCSAASSLVITSPSLTASHGYDCHLRSKPWAFLNCIAFSFLRVLDVSRCAYLSSRNASRSPLSSRFSSTAVQDAAFRRTCPPRTICWREIGSRLQPFGTPSACVFDSESNLSSCPRRQFLHIIQRSFASCRSPVDENSPSATERIDSELSRTRVVGVVDSTMESGAAVLWTAGGLGDAWHGRDG